MARRAKRKAPIEDENGLVPRVLPPNAYDHKGQLYPMARLKNPANPKEFYREGGVKPWVTYGYKTWTMAEWIDRFKGQQPDGRHWDFFGETIDIWEGYSESNSD